MDKNHKYTVEEVLEIVNTLEEKDKETLKSNLLLDEPEFEKLVKEVLVKYNATFKAHA